LLDIKNLKYIEAIVKNMKSIALFFITFFDGSIMHLRFETQLSNKDCLELGSRLKDYPVGAPIEFSKH
jgi:hypothetical protein